VEFPEDRLSIIANRLFFLDLDDEIDEILALVIRQQNLAWKSGRNMHNIVFVKRDAHAILHSEILSS
jgi:hypothetical protein